MLARPPRGLAKPQNLSRKEADRMAEYDQTKMDSYQLSDDEIDRLNRLIGVFIDDVKGEFGDRAQQALVNCLGSALAHSMNDHAEAIYIITTVNEWLEAVAENHGGLPLRLTWNDEPAGRTR